MGTGRLVSEVATTARGHEPDDGRNGAAHSCPVRGKRSEAQRTAARSEARSEAKAERSHEDRDGCTERESP
jgi:hypothetical protein